MKHLFLAALMLLTTGTAIAKGTKPPAGGGGTTSTLDPQSFTAPAGSVIYNTKGPIIQSSHNITTGEAKFYSNLAVMNLMSSGSVPNLGIFGVMGAYQACRALYPLDGQLRATGSITVTRTTFTQVRTDWVASRTMACFRGAYAGFLSSNDLGAYDISFSTTKSVGGTVCLTQAAVSNVIVALESYATTVATVPASVTIPAGSRCANYVVNIVGPFDTYIHAKLNGFWISKQLSVGP